MNLITYHPQVHHRRPELSMHPHFYVSGACTEPVALPLSSGYEEKPEHGGLAVQNFFSPECTRV